MAETEVEKLRKQREHIQRRMNMFVELSGPQLDKAVEYTMSTRNLSREDALQELTRSRFCWGSEQSTHGLSAVLSWNHALLDAIEEAAPLRNPCGECYEKTPEARAAKRKLAAELSAATKPPAPKKEKKEKPPTTAA